MNDKLPLLLVTANVGSLFEDIKHLLPKWCKEMTNKIATLGYPPFVAIHFQEIGGKYPQAAIDGIKQMNKQFLACEDLSNYTTVLGYFDQDFTNEDKYTALGAYFLIHKSLKNVAIWNYNDRRYETVKAGKQIFTDCLDSLNTIEKLKYPKEFFPEMKWSRKGYLKTKWKICGIVMNLINIHLFHDPSNLISLRSSPSVYAEYRKHAFEYVLNSLDEDPAFIFGDFNFRLDQCKLLKKLAKQCRVEMNYSDEEKETPIKLTLTEKES
ncbi:inositol polyphosphate-5-phosphatase A-like [Xenia sp. Carnegie-2017]|uniref:inositol polyphosphate-5-phosphatase A-like n=1 Tax=Xenia sp. Carnegie-2017 TaxID=2897299 RepID=UPI001F0412F1|nr:inositol polyphosphate-5-phosphatase A-like [Xenia sp. Carnegie-2017]